MCCCEILGSFTLKTPLIGFDWAITSQNPISQIKSYYGLLSGSHARSFTIHHEKWREAFPGEEITMTSYAVGNKTSLSRKPCIADKKLLWNAIRKSWKMRAASPSGGLTMTTYSVCNKTSLSRKPCILDNKVTIDYYKAVIDALSESVMKNCVQRPLAENWQRHRFRFQLNLVISETIHPR